MKGQFSFAFVTQVVLGFLLVIAMSYAALAMEESVKRDSQKQTLISVSEYAATEVLVVLAGLQPGQNGAQNFRLPLSRDYYSGQYSVALESVGGAAYIKVQSVKWPDMTARQPLFLNSSTVLLDPIATFPPGMCVNATRNTTHYTISIACRGS